MDSVELSCVCDVFRRKMVSDEDDDDENVMSLYACNSVVHFDDDTLSHVLPADVWLTLRYVEYGSQLSFADMVPLMFALTLFV